MVAIPSSAAAVPVAVVPFAFEREAFLVRLQSALQVALKVHRVGQVLQRLALQPLVADPPGHVAHALECDLRRRVRSLLRRLTAASRQRRDESVGDQLGLRQQELLAGLWRRRFDEAVGEIVDRGSFANELPLVAFAHVRQAPRGRGVGGEGRTARNSRGRDAIARRRHAHADAIASRERADDGNRRRRCRRRTRRRT